MNNDFIKELKLFNYKWRVDGLLKNAVRGITCEHPDCDNTPEGTYFLCPDHQRELEQQQDRGLAQAIEDDQEWKTMLDIDSSLGK